MNLAVCLKHVPDPDSIETDPFTAEIDTKRLLYKTNPADMAALELGLDLRSANGSGQILAITVGSGQSAETLRRALAVGADRVLRIWDENFSETYPILTSMLISGALRSEGLPDLILCGARSTDRGSGLVPVFLAERLGWAAVMDITSLIVHGKELEVERWCAHGIRERVRVTLPAVISVRPSIASLRYASLPGILLACRAIIPYLRPMDFGLSTSDLPKQNFNRRDLLPPKPRSRVISVPDSKASPYERINHILQAGLTKKTRQLLEDSPEKLAEALVEFLDTRKLIPPGHNLA